jgi:hypothetical protein
VKLRGRIYPTHQDRPSGVSISTRCSSHPTRERYPFAESLFNEATLQPYIHDIKVEVVERGNRYLYQVFVKRHCRLLRSLSLFHLDNDSNFRGDAVVMRIGCRGNVVNMRGRDTILADYLIVRWVIVKNT